jgi:hypothetical protein
MGQYFKAVFLDANENIIRMYVSPGSYYNGVKIMEHTFKNFEVMKAVEHLLSPQGTCYKMRLVWAGDYAEPEPIDGTEAEENVKENLYTKTYNVANCYKQYNGACPNLISPRYILNHSQKIYIDMQKGESVVHPLPLLTVESTCNYNGTNRFLVGTWARNIISMSAEIPDGFEELKCDFQEY